MCQNIEPDIRDADPISTLDTTIEALPRDDATMHARGWPEDELPAHVSGTLFMVSASGSNATIPETCTRR